MYQPYDSIRDQTSSPNVGGHQQPLISGSRELTIPKRAQSQTVPGSCQLSVHHQPETQANHLGLPFWAFFSVSVWT